jgi:TolB protein
VKRIGSEFKETANLNPHSVRLIRGVLRFAAEFLMILTAIMALGLAQAGEPVRLTTDGRVKRDPVFLRPDGSELLFAVLDQPKQLRLMRLTLASSKVESLHPDETRSEFEPAVSRDGRYLAFVQNRGNLSLALVIKDLMTGMQADVPPGGGFSGMHSPAFAPDNSRVLYSYPEDGRQNLFAVGIDAKQPKRLVDSSGINNWPSFSPDGRQVVFSSTRDGDYDLYVMKSDGSDVRRLTESPKQDIRPRWSPDGRRIAFTSNRDGNYEIYVVAPDGTGLSRLTNHPEQDDYACWHPASRRLVIVSERSGLHDLFLVDVP